MALILLSSRSMTRSGVTALTLRQVVIGAGVSCVVVGALAFVLGIVVGKTLESENQAGLAAAANPATPGQERFTYERLGALTGRVLSLESSASTLIKKITALDTLERKLGDLQSGFAPPRKVELGRDKNAGGPVLAPRCEQQARSAVTPAERFAQAERTVDCLQQVLSQVEAAAAAHSVAYMAVPSRAPVNSAELGSAFGNRIDPITGRIAFHSGLDFAAETGSGIYAAGGGRVLFSGWNGELGNVVEIDHGNGLVTRYAHASRLMVKTGDVVTPRQQIAAVGSTGRSTGPHLHFEVLHQGRYVDPQHYLQLGG